MRPACEKARDIVEALRLCALLKHFIGRLKFVHQLVSGHGLIGQLLQE